jgi:uncharacterized protein DUF1565
MIAKLLNVSRQNELPFYCAVLFLNKERMMNKIGYLILSITVVLTLTLGNYFNVRASIASVLLQSGITYYVSTIGNDTNSGTQAYPFKTFAKALSVSQSGDTIQAIPGTYSESINVTISGITLIGNGSILDMQGIQSNGISISGSHVSVSGFTMTRSLSFGIYVTGQYADIENNILHDNVTENGIGTCNSSSTSWGSAIKIKVGGDNSTIRGNTSYDNCGEGIAVARGITSLVEHNVAYDNFSVNIYIDNSPYSTVQNNLSYCTSTDTHLRNGNTATGIATGEEYYSGWGAQLHDILISNNAVVDCSTGIAAFASDVGGTFTNATISNNTIPSGQKRGISLQTASNQNVVVSYNSTWNSIYVDQPAGIALVGNVINTATITPTLGITPSSTSVPANTPTVTATASGTSTSHPTASPAPTTLSTSTFTLTPSDTPTFIPTQAFTQTASPVSASPTYTPTSIPPTPTLQATIQPLLATIYDDTNSSFVYSSGWNEVTNGNAYNGSYKQTSTKGSSTTLQFTGQSFSILYTAGPGLSHLNVYLDGVLVNSINEGSSTLLFQQRWGYPGTLSLGNHILKLAFTGTHKTKGTLDAVIVQ